MATTPNYSFSVYSSTDTDVRFLDFRVATAGSQSTSNFYVIDTVLKQHSDAIDSINATPSAFVVKGTYSSGSLYTASVANYPGYKNEQLIVLSLNQKNTGAVQININGTTNKDVMKYGSDGVLKAVDAGDFVANSPVLCLYDGTRFVVIGITSASSITVTGEAGDILQIADDGTIESSGKKAAQPNGIATLDENGNVVQVANMANSAAAVYDGEPVSVEYVGQNRIASITAYGETPQGGTTEAPVALTGVDSVFVGGRNLLPKATKTQTIYGVTFTPNPDGSVSIKGTATGWSSMVIDGDFSLPAGTYTLNSNTQTTDVGLSISKDVGGTQNIATSSTTSKTFTLPDSIKHYVAYIVVSPNSVVDTTVYPMLNLGSTAMPYEPYQGSVTTLPIPRPLRRVGDVQDVCVTRVKSVYDKRIVLDGSESWTEYTNEEWKGAGYHVYKFYDADALLSQPIVSNKYPSRRGAINFKGTLGVTSGTQSILFSVVEQKTVDDWKAYLAAQKAAGTPLTVYYRSTAYNGTNGLDVCQTEYQNGFVELDGTEGVSLGNIDASADVQQFNIYGVLSSPNNSENAICSHFERANVSGGVDSGFRIYNTLLVFGMPRDILLEYGFITGDSDTYVPAFKAYLAAQNTSGTPVQVAYQLASPETYATDPVDFDNTAGPLTIMTGGKLEVRMTELIGSRSDVSNNTVAFSEASQDADIASGEKLSVLFGKIKKRFSVVNKLVNGAVYPNLGTNTNFPDAINQRGKTTYTGDNTSPYCIDRWRISNGTTYTVGTFTLSAATYANRACGMWQSNEMGAHQLSIGDDVTVSIYANGKLHTPTMKVIDRDLYDAFANVPASYACDDFEIVLCTYAHDKTKYNLGIYPKKPLTVNYIKWEKGSAATPYVPKSYRAELAECQRYFYRIYNSTWQTGSLIYGWGFIVPFDTPVPMRSNPTINFVDAGLKVFTPSGWVNATSAETYGFNKNCARVNVKLIITLPSDIEGRSMLVTGIESFSADF